MQLAEQSQRHTSVGYFARIMLLLSMAPLLASPAETTFRIPPITTTIAIAEQPVAVTVSGTIQIAETAGAGEAAGLKMDAGLSDLQRQITPILRAQLNQDNHCGERLS